MTLLPFSACPTPTYPSKSKASLQASLTSFLAFLANTNSLPILWAPPLPLPGNLLHHTLSLIIYSPLPDWGFSIKIQPYSSFSIWKISVISFLGLITSLSLAIRLPSWRTNLHLLFSLPYFPVTLQTANADFHSKNCLHQAHQRLPHCQIQVIHRKDLQLWQSGSMSFLWRAPPPHS